MDQYELESKIRDVISELFTPCMQRIGDCLNKFTIVDDKMNSYQHQLSLLQLELQQQQYQSSGRFGELDVMQQMFKKLEVDFNKTNMHNQQQFIQLSSQQDRLKVDAKNLTENQEILTSMQIKAQTDVQIQNKKAVIQTEELHQKINDFFKEQYTHYVESRNTVNKVNKEITFITKDIQMHNNLLDKITLDQQSSKQAIKALDDQMEQIGIELNTLVNKDILQAQLDKDHLQHSQEVAQLNTKIKDIVESTGSQFKSLDERVSNQEHYELEYRQLLNAYQKDLHSVKEDFYQQLKTQQVELNLTSSQVISLSAQFKEQQDRITNSIQFQLQTIQSNNRKEMLKIQNTLDEYKQNMNSDNQQMLNSLTKQITKQLQQNLEGLKDNIFQEQKEQTLQLLSKFKEEVQIMQPTQQAEMRTIEVQVGDNNIQMHDSMNLIQIQEYVDKTIQETLQNKGSKLISNHDQFNVFDQKQMATSRLIRPRANSIKQILENAAPTQDKLNILSENMSDQIEELRVDISIVNELRDALEVKVRYFESEFNAAMERFERNHSTTLKLKSDVFNDNEYVNSQIKALFREKDQLYKKIGQLLQLQASSSECIYILMSDQLKNSKEILKFHNSHQGVVFEMRPDLVQYRCSQYSFDDLMKKAFIGSLELWQFYQETGELIETREYDPLKFFNSHIIKQQKTKRQAKDPLLKLTQTMILSNENENQPKSNARKIPRGFQSINTSCDTREKTMTVRRMSKQMHQTDRSVGSSPNSLPKVCNKVK